MAKIDLSGLNLDNVYLDSTGKIVVPNTAPQEAPGNPNPSIKVYTPAAGTAEKTSTQDRATRDFLDLLQNPDVILAKTFGGTLLQRQDASGNPILSFVVSSQEGNMLEAYISNATNAYMRQFCSGAPHMFGAAHPFVECFEEVNGLKHAVFNFAFIPGSRSLRQYCVVKAIPQETVMRLLTKMLVERYNTFIARQEVYSSLNCLSLDTLFVSPLGKLILLPLQPFNCHPKEIAPEAGDPQHQCTEVSDLFAAAYVSLAASYSGNLPEMPVIRNETIRDCIATFPQFRPKLETVAAEFCSGQSPSSIPDPAPAPRERAGFADSVKAFWHRFIEWVRPMFTSEPKAETGGTLGVDTRRNLRPITNTNNTDEDLL